MRAAEEAAFARGITAEALMDKAGEGIARAVQTFFPHSGRCIVFNGKGNNGGDALVAARHLERAGWKIDISQVFAEAECGDLTRRKLETVAQASRLRSSENAIRRLAPPLIILDGLLGLGAKPPLREPILSACRKINALRRDIGAFVFAIDLPTGLDADSGEADPDCVIADFTVTIGFAKRGLLADRATNVVGRIEVVALSDLTIDGAQPTDVIATPEALRALLPRREFDAHKFQFGRVGIVAGSKGFLGAALLTAEGALRGGAGLVNLFVLEEIYPLVAAAAPREAMVKPVQSYRELFDPPLKIDVWAVGPGLGEAHAEEIIDLIARAEQPMVIDADGLNILADKIGILQNCKRPRLLTPHTGEMKRLTNDTGTREEIARKFTQKYPVTLLLKGGRTIVADGQKPLSYNTTGNPGMATGGMGDVLTGVCAALIAQKLSTYDAARVAGWVCGRAAELARFQGKESEQSLLARDVLENLGGAFSVLQGRGD